MTTIPMNKKKENYITMIRNGHNQSFHQDLLHNNFIFHPNIYLISTSTIKSKANLFAKPPITTTNNLMKNNLNNFTLLPPI
jgi:hypothetical protein